MKKNKTSNKSKTKGNKFEIKTAKNISLWISDNNRDDLIWHSSSSGARATSRKKTNQNTVNSCGDLCYLDAEAEPYMKDYLFELKSGYTQKTKIVKDKKTNKPKIKKTGKHISIADLLDGWGQGARPLLLEWLDKAKKEAKQHNKKHFVIIYKRDYKDACIVFQEKTFDMIIYNNEKRFTMGDGKLARIYIDKYKLVIINLQDFFDWCYPKALYEKINIGLKIRGERGKYSGKKCSNKRRKV